MARKKSKTPKKTNPWRWPSPWWKNNPWINLTVICLAVFYVYSISCSEKEQSAEENVKQDEEFAPDARAQNVEEILKKAIKSFHEKDYTEAVALFHKAAEQENAGAQGMLGTLYAEGKGVKQDHKKAAEWYRKAAEQGLAEAQNNLGILYAEGKGVKQDHKKAVEWYSKVAVQGNAYGQYNLGKAYFKGRGVLQNYSKAAEWYFTSAAQGHAGALYDLAVMHKNGYGVEKSPVVADVFFLLSARGGNIEAQKVVEKFNKKLTKGQIAAIEDLASNFGAILEKLKK